VVYRKIRRLLPFIICHFAWDASIAINGYSKTAAVIFNGIFFISALAFTLLWSREGSDSVQIPAGQVFDRRTP
jgi:uncharacterized membrane protein